MYTRDVPLITTSLSGDDWVYLGLLTSAFLFLIVAPASERKKIKKKRAGVFQTSEIEEELRPMREREVARLNEEILQRSRRYLRR
jgi:hypothetical protein